MKDDRVFLQHSRDAIEKIEAYARPASVTGKACVRRSRTIDGLRPASTEPRVQVALREALNDAAFKIRWKAAGIMLPFEEREAMRVNR